MLLSRTDFAETLMLWVGRVEGRWVPGRERLCFQAQPTAFGNVSELGKSSEWTVRTKSIMRTSITAVIESTIQANRVVCHKQWRLKGLADKLSLTFDTKLTGDTANG